MKDEEEIVVLRSIIGARLQFKMHPDGIARAVWEAGYRPSTEIIRERDAALKMVGELMAMLKEYAPGPCECEMCQRKVELFTRAQALLNEHPETGKETR